NEYPGTGISGPNGEVSGFFSPRKCAMAIQVAGSVQQWQTGGWLSDGSLEAVADLNLQCIDLLAAMAAVDPPHAPGLPALQGPLWQELPAPARQRLASSPWLLVDAGFDDLPRWRSLEQRMVHDLPAQYAQPVF